MTATVAESRLAGVRRRSGAARVDDSSGGLVEAMRQQRKMVSMIPAEVVHEQVRRPEDRGDKPEDKRHHQGGRDDDEREDRQRWAHQEPDEHNGGQLDGAERISGCEGCQRGVLLEFLGGRERLIGVRCALDLIGLGVVMAFSLAPARACSHPDGTAGAVPPAAAQCRVRADNGHPRCGMRFTTFTKFRQVCCPSLARLLSPPAGV